MSDYSIYAQITADDSGFQDAIEGTIGGLSEFGAAFASMNQTTKQSFANLANEFTAIEAKSKIWGNEIDVIGDKKKSLRTEINRLIDQGIAPESKQIQDLKKAYDDLGESNKKTGLSFASLRDIMQGPIAAMKLLKDAISGMWDVTIGSASALEDMEAAFTPLVGGAENAKEMIAALNKEAATTPFELEGIGNVAKQLLPILGNNVEAVTETFRMLGDTAGGNITKLDSITRGYVKALNSGKVSLEALNMISDAGVPIMKELSDSMGISTAELYKLITAGKVADSDLTAAFKSMTSEGGIFFNGMEISSQTLSGKISTMQDSFKMAGAAIGEVFIPAIKTIVGIISDIVGSFASWAAENDNLANTLKYLTIGLASGAAVFGAFAVAMNIGSIITGVSTAMGGLVVAIKAITTALAANPFMAIATIMTAVLVPAIIMVVDKLGGWGILFMEIQKIALSVVGGILDYFSWLANSIVATMNTLFDLYNKVITVIGGKPIKLFDYVDLKKAAKIEEKIDDINSSIKKQRDSTKDLTKENTSSTKTILKNTDDVSDANTDAAKLAVSWSDKVLKTTTDNLKAQKDAALAEAKARNASVAEVAAIAKKYDDEILANYLKDISSQRTASLAEAKEKKADAATVANINAYYDTEITNFKNAQTVERAKLEKSYTEELKKQLAEQSKYVAIELNAQDSTIKNIVGSWKNYWHDATEEIKKNAADWSDVLKSVQSGLTSVVSSGLTNLGKALVNGSFDWQDFADAATGAIAGVLKALGDQLAAMAAVKFLMGDFAGAAVGAAAAAGAYVASGVVGALADTSSRAKSASASVQKLAAALDATVASAEDFASVFATKISSGQTKAIISSLSSQTAGLKAKVDAATIAYNKLYETYKGNTGGAMSVWQVQQASAALNKATAELNANLDAIAKAQALRQNIITNGLIAVSTEMNATNAQIAAYKDMFTSADMAQMSFMTSLQNVKQGVESLYASFADIGTDIGKALVDNLSEGLNAGDFMTKMKEYITNLVVQTAIYTDALTSKIAQIGARIAAAVASGVSATDMGGIVAELKTLYDTAAKQAAAATSIVSQAFSGYASGTTNATRGVHLVGEQGPELRYFRGGETVLNARDTASVLSGQGNVTLAPVFNSPKAMNQAEQMRALRNYQKRLAFRGVIG